MVAFGGYVLLNPRLVWLARQVYVPVYLQFVWMSGLPIRTIIDVGAHEGRVSETLLWMFPSATAFAFEPDEELCNRMNHSPAKQRMHVVPMAVTDASGQVVFNVNESSQWSSLFPVSKEARRAYPFAAKTRTVQVPTTTLDDFFSDVTLDGDVLLKIDTQGAEHLVLDGAIATLERVSIIHIETAFRRTYDGQCLFEDVHSRLSAAGFTYLGSVRGGDFYPEFGLPLQENSIFVREPDRFREYAFARDARI
jgi:FkbM family methyltransferase